MSSNKHKTKEQLLDELALLRQRVAELEETAAESKKAEVRYTALVESGNDGIIVIQDGLLKFANKKIFEMTGFSPEEAKDKPFLTFVVPEYRSLVADRYIRRMAGEEVSNRYEVEIIGKDGKRIPVEINASIIEYEGKPADLAILRDMTERKQAEADLRQSEERLRWMFQSISEGIIVWDLNQTITSANERMVAMFGYRRPEEMVGKKITEFVAPDSLKQALPKLQRTLQQGWSQGNEYSVVKADGTEFLIEASTNVIKDAAGTPTGYISIVSDITERKKAEEMVKTAERNFRNSMEGSPLSVRIISQEGELFYANKTTLEITGYGSIEELKAIPLSKLYTPQSYAQVLLRMERRARGESIPYPYEVSIVRKDGEVCQMLVFATGVIWDNQKRLQIVWQDITERKQAEETLQASEERFRNLVENAPVGIVIIDSVGRLIDINETIWRMHGYQSKEEYMRASVADRYYDPKDRERWMAQVRETGKITSFEVRNKRKDGRLFWASVTGIRQTGKSGEPQYVAIVRDITQQKQAEDELRESEERYRALIKLGSDVGEAVVMLWETEKGEAVHAFASEAWAKITGYSQEELFNMPFSHLVHPKDRQAARDRYFRRLRGEAMPGLYEITIIRKDGTEVIVEITGAGSNYKGKPVQVLYVRDITQRKKMEEQLMAQDRLASIGQLVSGVAHELNNPLTGVIGFSELLLQRGLPDDIREDIKVVHREAMRTATIVRNLLTFARKQPQEKQPAGINESIRKVLELRAYEQNVSNIKVNTHLAPDLPDILGNSSQLQQVFINIIINAEFFMTEAHQKGTLTITTKRAGNFIRASFTDDGPGISKENMRQLFNPFFTTKEVGQGTGLGLSICHGIITEHGGKIWAESALGKGATFIIELPIPKTEKTVTE